MSLKLLCAWSRACAVTFQVREYWKGNPNRRVTLYDLEPGMDCYGADFEAGQEYLVYGVMDRAKDYKLDDVFWFGWTDLLSEDTPILVPVTACMPWGKTSSSMVRAALRKLGYGRVPAKD